MHRRLGVVSRFAVLSAVLICALGIVLARSVGNAITNRNLASARQTAVLAARLAVQPRLNSGELANGLTPIDIGYMNNALEAGFQNHDIARIKIWNRDLRVVYSDDASLIGRRFPTDDDVREALEGETASDVSNLSEDENTQDRGSGARLLEVYTPLRFDAGDKPEGAFEIYLPYAPIAQGIHEDVLHLWVIIIAGLGLLYLALFRIVQSASRRLRKELRRNEHLAAHDPLTDLVNRARFDELTTEALREVESRRGHVAVLLVDVDRFKDVNDVLGHACGDIVLQELGRRLQDAIPGATVARLGGDEFAVLLRTVTAAPAALDAAQRALSVFRRPITVDGLPVELDASIGVAVAPAHGTTAAALMQRADIAMYVAKRTHSGAELFAIDQDSSSRTRLTMLGELRHAIETGELVLYYQPQLELRTGAIRGFEALVRWNHPVRGVLAPAEFLPLAEHTGLVRPLTRRVLELAARQSAAWRADGVALPISVNLSASNLHDTELPKLVRLLLEAHRLPNDAFNFEITESTIMHDSVRAVEVVKSLRALGARISIDDFGTGYSSFAYLQQLAVDEIKVDMSFVLEMVDNADDATIVRTTIALGHSLRLEVVAEGVETSEALVMLREMGCDLAQGYWLSRPLPAVEALEWLRRHGRGVAAPERWFSKTR
ncbi:MAG TPA: EAL domain-containing protein [Acidimicrobiia bacterium]|nr:EAL domain-containing protein [Acidimicrobiia bacterium]